MQTLMDAQHFSFNEQTGATDRNPFMALNHAIKLAFDSENKDYGIPQIPTVLPDGTLEYSLKVLVALDAGLLLLLLLLVLLLLLLIIYYYFCY